MLTRAWLGGYSAETRWSPLDDRWYEQRVGGGPIHAGVTVNEQSALTISALFACCRIIAGCESMVPFKFYRWIDESTGDKEEARGHYLYAVMHDQPNGWQTAVEFREQMTFMLALHGNSYAEIIRDRGLVVELHPIHPSRVRIELLPKGSRHRYRYHVTDEWGQTRRLLADEVMHLRDVIVDPTSGIGISRMQASRQGLGLSLVSELHGARYFGQGGMSTVEYSTEKGLNPPQRQEWQDSMEKEHFAPGRSWRPILHPHGIKPVAVVAHNRNSQHLETREFQVADIARWYGMPLHLIQHESKDTSWGSGLGENVSSFLKFGMGVWYVKWKQAVRRDLMLPQDRTEFFGEHVLAGLLYGDMKSLYEMFTNTLNSNRPHITVNEARRALNLAPKPNGDSLEPSLNVRTDPGSALYDGYGRELKVAA